MCGEKARRPLWGVRGVGSPPRVRGKAHALAASHKYYGITPACAGKRCAADYCSVRSWDHPRVCGEKDDGYVLDGEKEGSPPRVRGKESSRFCSTSLSGITPACAGKSLLPLTLSLAWRDHPRVCGEKPDRQKGAKTCLGSPPRVRGKDHCARLCVVQRGITPACAGKSFPPCSVCLPQ